MNALTALIDAVEAEIAIADKVDPEGLFLGIEQIRLRESMANAKAFLDHTEVNPIPCLERDKAMRDDLIVTMLAMLQDLHDGYPWRELGIDMDEIHAHVAALGIEHDVPRSQP